ncbi:MAG: RNA polymerase sigma-54 factor, partial [Candidatus Dadabacteria bacterium]
SSSSIKQKIKNLIAAEDPENPLSDQKIVELLKEQNIEIARRTVAKYREGLGILSSSKRKKLF